MKTDPDDMKPFQAGELVTCIHCGYTGGIAHPWNTEDENHQSFDLQYMTTEWDNKENQWKHDVEPFLELTCPACRATYKRAPKSACEE